MTPRPVSPEAAPEDVCSRCGIRESQHRLEAHDFLSAQYPEAAPPRATTPPMTPESLMLKHSYTSWTELLADAELGASVRAGAPSRDSGALLDAYERCVFAAGAYPDGESQEAEDAHRARCAVDDHLSTLEQDAARMRERLERARRICEMAAAYIFEHDNPEGQFVEVAERVDSALNDLREAVNAPVAALAPSGEPTTTPEQCELCHGADPECIECDGSGVHYRRSPGIRPRRAPTTETPDK